jgi:sec-independent protein translocase protein TatB
MFDLTSSKLLLLGIVALLVVGPKDLPMLLRTLGKYIGMIKRQAAEFRSQFDDAMRDAELQQLKKDVESLGEETEKAMRDGERELEREMSSVNRDVDQAIQSAGSAPASEAAAIAESTSAGALPPPPQSPAEIAAAVAAPKSAG